MFYFELPYSGHIFKANKVLSVNCGGSKRSWDVAMSSNRASFAFTRLGQAFQASHDGHDTSLIIQVLYFFFEKMSVVFMENNRTLFKTLRRGQSVF